MERPGAEEQPPPAVAADREADVVADDRRGGRDRDQRHDDSCPSCASSAAAISAVSPGTGMPIVSTAISAKTAA